MRARLEEQLRRYRNDFEAAQREIRLDDVRTRPIPSSSKPVPQARGWLVAVAAAAVVLLGVGVATLGLQLLTGTDKFVGNVPTTVTPKTTLPPPTTVLPDGTAPFAAQLFTPDPGEHEIGMIEVAVGLDGIVWGAGLEANEVMLYRLERASWVPIGETLPGIGIEWMVPAPGGGVLVGDPACAVAVFNGEHWTSLDVPPMLRCSAQAANDGRAWIFGYNEDQAPTFVEVRASGVVTHPSGPIPPSFPVAELRLTFDVAPDGTLWYGTADGAWSHDGKELTFHPLDASEGCCPPSLAAGQNGDVWVQLGADVFWYSNGVWTRFTPDDGLPDYGDADPATVIPTADGDVWIINTSSVARFDGAAWTTSSAAEVIEQGIAFGHSGVSVESPDGSTWMLNYAPGGSWWLARYADGRWEGGVLNTMRWAEPSPGSLQVNRLDLFNRPLVVAPDGNVWIATTRGVTRITIVE